MKQYICVECESIYNDSNKPADFVCKKNTCPGNGLTGLIIEMEQTVQPPPIPGAGATVPPPIPGYGATNPPSVPIQTPPPLPIEKEVGLCVLLMDASGSMFMDPAFKGQGFPSSFGHEFLNKAEMVAKCAANAIFQLKDITLKEHQEAYIMAIKFDHRQSVMFHKSIRGIIEEFRDSTRFAKYLYDSFSDMQGGTNINGALDMAYSFISKFKAGNIPGIGAFEPMHDSIYLPNKGGDYEIPNIRAMIYTDGEQLSDYGSIRNPFKAHDPDLLLGAFIGDQDERGCTDLRSIISKCPIHQQDQFFVIDNPQRQATLRRLFRMASDASGFCPACIPPSQLR